MGSPLTMVRESMKDANGRLARKRGDKVGRYLPSD